MDGCVGCDFQRVDTSPPLVPEPTISSLLRGVPLCSHLLESTLFVLPSRSLQCGCMRIPVQKRFSGMFIPNGERRDSEPNQLFCETKAKCSCQLKGRAKLLVRIVSYHTELTPNLVTQCEAKSPRQPNPVSVVYRVGASKGGVSPSFLPNEVAGEELLLASGRRLLRRCCS